MEFHSRSINFIEIFEFTKTHVNHLNIWTHKNWCSTLQYLSIKRNNISYSLWWKRNTKSTIAAISKQLKIFEIHDLINNTLGAEQSLSPFHTYSSSGVLIRRNAQGAIETIRCSRINLSTDRISITNRLRTEFVIISLISSDIECSWKPLPGD